MVINIMSVKSSTELMLYVVLTMPTLNKAYLFIYLFHQYQQNEKSPLILTEITEYFYSHEMNSIIY